MAYVTIPKDLSKVQSKVLFGLTKRQVICFGGTLHDPGDAALLPVRHV